jgi:hypothetical protein
MPDVLVIRNVTLIDGKGVPALECAAIVIEGDRIVAAGGDAPAPNGAQVIDGSGRWAVPGLIDTHVHSELVGREALPIWLALGVTTLRDLGGALDFLVETRRLLEDGLAGPRVLFAGPMIDGDPPTWPALNLATKDGDAAVRAVDDCLEAGADAIKLYTTLEPDPLRRCIDHVAGRVPVTGHLGRTLSSEAMAAGINGLEHALLTPYNDLAPEAMRTAPGEVMLSPGFWIKVNDGWAQMDLASDRVRRWIELLVAKDVSLAPTLTVVPLAGDQPSEDELRYVPTVAERWLEATQQRQAAGPMPPEIRERGQAARRKLQKFVAMVHEAGGRIVSGTDTGAIRSLVPGFSLHRELGFLSGAGLSNMDVLRAATSRAAEALGRNDLGSIVPGKRADVLLLRRDPLDDVSALRDIECVIHDGRIYDPTELLAAAASGPVRS